MAVITVPTQKATLFSALNALASEIDGIEKQSSAQLVKRAGPVPSDPGGYQGPTTHPVKDIDNDVQDATEGARSAENTADVKADIKAPSVDSTPDATEGGGDADADQLNIGMTQSSTGNDPSVEDAYKDKKDDPGTTMPAKADNGGEKYASVSFRDGMAKSAQYGNAILADLANGFGAALIKGAKALPNPLPVPATVQR